MTKVCLNCDRLVLWLHSNWHNFLLIWENGSCFSASNEGRKEEVRGEFEKSLKISFFE